MIVIFGVFGTSVGSAANLPTAAAGTDATDVAQAGPLSDVPLNSWAYDAVEQLAKDGIIKGYPDGTFKGNRPMTRYEAAVLAYRAVDMLEAQITAGKAVEKADIDAANKLLAAYGNELKAVERHVDALQKEADATQKDLAATTALGAATAATVRRAQIHLVTIYRAVSYGQNIQANAGPLPETFNGVVYAPASALPSGIGSAPTGSALAGSYTTPGGVVTPGAGPTGGLSWGPQPMYTLPQNSSTTGTYNHGLGTQYMSLQFAGNPDDHSQFVVKLTNLERYSATNFYPSEVPSACTAATIGVAGAACSAANAGVSNADGTVTNFVRLADMWYQYTSPGGIYAKVGKFQQDEGPKQVVPTQWGLVDYTDGFRIGYRNSRFNAQLGYGFEDTAAQQNLLYNLPFSSVETWAQADYQLDGKGHTDIGAYYSNYSGFHSALYDPYAVLCIGTGVVAPGAPAGTTAVARTTSKILPLVAGQVYSSGGCGSGYTPIVYGAPGAAAGLPITGAYIDGSTTATAAGATAPHDDTLGGFIVGNYGRLRVVLEGTDRLGNDPTTGSKYLGNLSGFFQADYGPFLAAPGVRGRYTLELGGFAAGLNGLGAGYGYYGSPALWSQFSTDFSDYYFLFAGVKKFITDTAYLGVWYVNMGLLPNTTIPAGSPQCPGCVITGDHRNAVYGELSLAF